MSSVPYITRSAAGIDLSPRFAYTTTVAASPSANAETVIASLTVSSSVAVATGALLIASASYTVGTSGTAATFKLRQTGTAGTTLYTTGAITQTAGNLYTHALAGIDTAPVLPGQVYVVTLTVTGGAATSTVSAVFLGVIIV